MSLTDFIAQGCPGLDKTTRLCSSFHKLKYATYGYAPLKVLSQCFHILGLLNAVKIIRTNSIRLNIADLNTRIRWQDWRFRLQIGLALSAFLFYVICSGLIRQKTQATTAFFIDAVFGVLLPFILNFHHTIYQAWFHESALVYYYGEGE